MVDGLQKQMSLLVIYKELANEHFRESKLKLEISFKRVHYKIVYKLSWQKFGPFNVFKKLSSIAYLLDNLLFSCINSVDLFAFHGEKHAHVHVSTLSLAVWQDLKRRISRKLLIFGQPGPTWCLFEIHCLLERSNFDRLFLDGWFWAQAPPRRFLPTSIQY